MIYPLRSLAAAAVLITLVVPAGCARTPYAISGADRQRFADNLITVHVPGKADPLILGSTDCKVYRAKIERQDITGWEVTLAADWGATYPAFMTACLNDSLSWDGKYVKVYFCARAIGAGGGCTNGGHYRSRTGARPWQISLNSGQDWAALPR